MKMKMKLKEATSTAYIGANSEGYPGTRYVIDCGGAGEKRFVVKMNPFTLEEGQEIIEVVKRGDGVGMWRV